MFNPQPRNDRHFHYPFQCIWLKLNGSWPLSSAKQNSPHQTPFVSMNYFALAYTLWSWYVIISVGITIYFQSCFLINNFGDIIMTTENCCTTLMGALNFVRLLHMRFHQAKFREIIAQFVKDIWIEKNTHPSIERLCLKNMNTFRIMTLLLACLILMYCFMPLFELLLMDDTSEKPFPYKMLFPYDAHHGWRYVITYMFTAYAGICVVTTLFAEDSIFGFFVTYTCGQFRILHERIDEIIPHAYAECIKRNQAAANADSVFPSEEQFQQAYVQQLNNIAYTHNKLIQFVRHLENFFNLILLINFMISSILICMVGFQLVTGKDMFIGDYVKFIVYISSSLSQLYILCFNGDLLIQHSTETFNHLYACNWEGGSITKAFQAMHNSNIINVTKAKIKWQRLSHERLLNKQQYNQHHQQQQQLQLQLMPDYLPTNQNFRQNLCIMIMCSQRPVRITAFKFSTLSLQSFTAILSTSMSYFTLLQTVYYDNQDN